MSVLSGYVSRAKYSVSCLAIISLVSVPAFAQHNEYGNDAVVEQALYQKNLSVPVVTNVAGSIQDLFVAETFSTVFENRFDEGVAISARAAYAQNVFEPVWTPQGADELLNVYDVLCHHGVATSEAEKQAVSDLIKARFLSETPGAQAEADIALTVKWLGLAERISGGLASHGVSVSAEGDMPARSGLVQAIVMAGEGHAADVLWALEPVHPQYVALKDQLAEYRQIVEMGGWKAIPESRDALEPGQSDPRVPALRERLILEGYYSGPSITEIASLWSAAFETEGEFNVGSETPEEIVNNWAVTFDADLEAALKAFQKRHGLADDGVLGRKTLEALNESAESKVQRIIDTMDQWRAMNAIDGRYVWANIPSYTAEGWADGHRELTMRTIVGMPSRETPIFSDEIEYAVANPKWYAPVSIVLRDKLPKLQKDPSYAARHGYTIYDRETGDRVAPETVNWSDTSSASQFQFVQASGRGNALGALKIIFPNAHSVYLHGTPDKRLFERSERALSSGCVRLEDPASMARWISGGDETEVAHELDAALNSGNLKQVPFAEKTPVHITYMTVTVDDDGQVSFWRDIYHHDKNIAQTREFAAPYQPIEPIVPEPDLAIASVASEQIQTAHSDEVQALDGGQVQTVSF